jgi:DNA-binding NarL/FixJ family response regulator
MAAHGLGNIEIAQTLFVTRKTVEKHLGNVPYESDLGPGTEDS